MAPYSLSLVLLILAYSAFSAPLSSLKQVEASSTSSAATTEKTPSPVLLSSPVTFGDLTAPSQGGTFNDFLSKPNHTEPLVNRVVSRFIRYKPFGSKASPQAGLVPRSYILGAIKKGACAIGFCFDKSDGDGKKNQGPGGGGPPPAGGPPAAGGPPPAGSPASGASPGGSKQPPQGPPPSQAGQAGQGSSKGPGGAAQNPPHGS